MRGARPRGATLCASGEILGQTDLICREREVKEEGARAGEGLGRGSWCWGINTKQRATELGVQEMEARCSHSSGGWKSKCRGRWGWFPPGPETVPAPYVLTASSLCPQDPAASSSSWLQGVLVSEERQAGVPRRWLEGLRGHFHFLPPPRLHCLGLHPSVSLLHRKWDGETCEPPLLGEGWPQGTMAFPEGSPAIGQPVSGCCTGPSPPSALACWNRERVGSSCITKGLKPLICTLASG